MQSELFSNSPTSSNPATFLNYLPEFPVESINPGKCFLLFSNPEGVKISANPGAQYFNPVNS
jgi:hypothetical protein